MRDVLTKKRRIRNAAPSRRKFTIDDYLNAKITYQYEAETAATQHWKEFCSTQDRESMWDGIYRVLRKTTKRQEDTLLRDAAGLTLSPQDSANLLARTFYPDDSVDNEAQHHTHIRRLTEGKSPADIEELSDDDPPFTKAELDMVLRAQNPKKAPGPDGLTSDICAAAIQSNREVFLALANRCLSLPYFPEQWKVAHVCIIRKPGKEDYTQPKSYRPIGLLSVFGKIVEKLLVSRIQWHLLPKICEKQYGFMPQRGTEDALYDLINHVRAEIRLEKIVLLVSLDIEGAFDNAWWPALKLQLVEKRCPRNLYALVASYLENRKIRVNYARATSEKGTTKGCVQGSIGGPTFWNLILDPLLRKMSDTNTYCQAFADDVVLVFSEHSVSTLQQKAETTLASVHEWGVHNKLNFAAHKTNAMVITKKLKYDLPQVNMCGTRLNLVKEVKLLGLIIDCKLTFNAHVTATCTKAADIYKQLACAAKVTWGLNGTIVRTIYVSVIEPIVLYAASAWSPAAEKLMVRNQLDSLQRGFAQKICKAYRTVSLTSALVLSGLLPLDLRVHEAATLFKVKKGHTSDFVPPGRELERKVGPLQNPHPAKLQTTEYERLDKFDKDTVESLQIVGPTIYTDGSKIEGKVGAALTLWNNEKENRYSTFRLEPHNTVFQSEMYALFRAVRLVKEMRTAQVVNIMSDSRSSLDLLSCTSVTHQLALEIKRLIQEIGREGRVVRFFWLRAHIGTPGNERADHLAKKAALTKKTAPDYDHVPISFVRKQIREGTVLRWQMRYESSGTGSVTKAFLPSVSMARRVLKDLQLTPMHVQILTGHGGFASYLNRFKIKDSPSCVCNPDQDETIWHVLLECPRYGLERMELEIKIQTKLTQASLPTIMEDQTNKKSFLDFASRVATSAAISNGSTAVQTRQSTSCTTMTQCPRQLPPSTQQQQQQSSSPDRLTPTQSLLQSGELGTPGLRTRGVALFMDEDNERLGLAFCRVGTRGKVISSPGLALLLNGSTSRTSIKREKLSMFSETRVEGQPCRIARLRNKTVVLFEWDDSTPFARACRVLSSLGTAGGGTSITPRRISVDAMEIEFERGEIVDRIGGLAASERHEVVMYESRGEDLSFLKAPIHYTPPAAHHRDFPHTLPQPGSSLGPQSGSERLQQKTAEANSSPQSQSGIKAHFKAISKVVKHLTGIQTPRTRLDRQADAVTEFLRSPSKSPPPRQPPRTRADKGQVSPPSLRHVAKPKDHAINAVLEFEAVLRATRQVNQTVCINILRAFQHEQEGLLKVRLEEAEAAIYDNDTSQVIKGNMSGQYMAAYSATSGFVSLNESETLRTGRLTYATPPNDPIVVTARCTRIMLDDRFLKMAKIISGTPGSSAGWDCWTLPKFKWVNGVPGCGKSMGLVENFDEERDVVITTTVEAVKDMRRKLAHRIGEAAAQTRVRTMASVLANGFREPNQYSRMTIDEALMNHFGAIVMAARLSGVSEVVLMGDINQLPYIDRENLFELRYSRPDTLATIDEERLCTQRSPMDVAYALSEVYTGMYSSTSRVHSLGRERYSSANIPPDLPNTLYLVHTQEEKQSLTNQGFGSGAGSCVLTIHESQGLTFASTLIIQTRSSKLRLHESVPHAVVAVSRHTEKCVYYTDNADDAIGRFVVRAKNATRKMILDHNLKMAIKSRDAVVVESLVSAIRGETDSADDSGSR